MITTCSICPDGLDTYPPLYVPTPLDTDNEGEAGHRASTHSSKGMHACLGLAVGGHVWMTGSSRSFCVCASQTLILILTLQQLHLGDLSCLSGGRVWRAGGSPTNRRYSRHHPRSLAIVVASVFSLPTSHRKGQPSPAGCWLCRALENKNNSLPTASFLLPSFLSSVSKFPTTHSTTNRFVCVVPVLSFPGHLHSFFLFFSSSLSPSWLPPARFDDPLPCLV
jgi:hypothetical protein